MNNKMKGFIELAQQDFAQAMELMAYMPGAKEAILKHTYPKANPQHRNFFLDAAKDPQTDPETLDMLGKRDLPRKIRYAVMDNPSTKRETIEKMARQSANDAVRFRAQKFLQTNPNLPKGDIMETKFKLSTKEIKQIIKEELEDFLSHPVARMMNNILSAAMTANYQKIMKTFEENARTLHIERSALGSHKGSHKKQLLDMLADAMYTYQKSHGADGLEQLIKIAEDIKFEYETHDERDIQEEPPF